MTEKCQEGIKVCELYGLAEGEIALVEGAAEKEVADATHRLNLR